MKNQLKISLIVILPSFILFLCLHVFVNLKGRDLLIGKLERAFKRKVEIGSLTTSFPANIYVKNIKVEGLFKIDEVYAGGGAFDIFRKDFKISLLKLTRPETEFNIRSAAEESPQQAQGSAAGLSSDNAAAIADGARRAERVQKRITLPKFRVDRLIIKDGKINLTDNVSEDKKISILVRDIHAEIEDLNFTGRDAQKTDFELSAKIPWQNNSYEGTLRASGWINLFKKDIDAVFKITDIDGVYLHSYYSKWVDLEKARIEKAKLNFSSRIEGLDNDVTADCHLELTDIVRRPRSQDEPEDKAEKIADVLLGIFRALNEGKIVLDFKIKTKLDYPQFSFEDIKQAVERQVNRSRGGVSVDFEQIALLPANLIRSTVRGFTGMFRAVIDGVYATGKVFSDTIAGTVKNTNKTKE